MSDLQFLYEQTALLNMASIKDTAQQLMPTLYEIKDSLEKKYTTDYASLYLPFDKELLKKVQTLVAEKKKLDPVLVVVIGIGGSNLGTMAVQKALLGKMYPQILYADTVDTDYISDLLNITERYLQQQKTVIVNVLSKSGTTTETVANFELFLALLQQYHPTNYKDYIVVTTDKDSKLWHLAEKERFSCLEIPGLVGGRFSVLSAVGLFPLGLLNITIEQLLAGAQDMQKKCLDQNLYKNPALASACIKYLHYTKGISIADMFLFSVDAEALGKWYRQLMGESLGKTVTDTTTKVGITPTVTIGSTDLHSVGQLYLGGPKDRFTTFVSFEKNKHTLAVPDNKEFGSIVANIQNRPLSSIMHAIIEGTQRAYSKTDLPFCSVILPQKNEYYLGQFLQMYMLEIIYLGKLLDVNPFDQPHVELYKKETREILAHE